jgi:hypothetical protein
MGNPQWQDAPHEQDALVKIYHAESGSSPLAGSRGALSPDMRLSELVRVWYKPVYLIARDSRERNIEQVDETVALWVAITADPPIDQIDAWSCSHFVAGLKKRKGRKYPTIGNNTIRKHCGAIQTILDLCGPPSRTNREGLGLLDASAVPYVTRPPADESEAGEDTFTLAQLVKLIDNADAARLPQLPGCTPGMYFRRLYAWTFNTGLRIGGTMMSSWRGYRGDHLNLQARVAAKGHRSKRVELNEVAQQIVESMRGIDAERIFPWPRAWPASRKGLYIEHRRIVQFLPKDERYAFHAVRRLHNHELLEINPIACQKSLGHRSARTTIENYTGRKVVAAAVARLPLVRPHVEHQRELF